MYVKWWIGCKQKRMYIYSIYIYTHTRDICIIRWYILYIGLVRLPGAWPLDIVVDGICGYRQFLMNQEFWAMLAAFVADWRSWVTDFLEVCFQKGYVTSVLLEVT